MNNYKCAICFVLIVLFVIGACGCMNTGDNNASYTNAEYSAAIEEYLSDKYAMSFKVDSLGGTYGTADDTTVKAWCYSLSGDYADVRFMAEINKKDFGSIKDNYLHIVSADMISKQLCNDYNNVEAYSVVESSAYSSLRGITDLNAYLEELDTYFVTTHFFVKASEKSSVDDYTNMVLSIGEKAKQLDLKDICVVVWFVDELSADIARTFKDTSIDKIYDAFLIKDYINCHATIQMLGDKITTSRETIQSSLEKGVK